MIVFFDSSYSFCPASFLIQGLLACYPMYLLPLYACILKFSCISAYSPDVEIRQVLDFIFNIFEVIAMVL